MLKKGFPGADAHPEPLPTGPFNRPLAFGRPAPILARVHGPVVYILHNFAGWVSESLGPWCAELEREGDLVPRPA